jgi:hypothetical protein
LQYCGRLSATSKVSRIQRRQSLELLAAGKLSAPLRVMAPMTSQTSKSHMGEPNAFAMPAGVRKIPTAMIPPITAEVVEARPSSRRKP